MTPFVKVHRHECRHVDAFQQVWVDGLCNVEIMSELWIALCGLYEAKSKLSDLFIYLKIDTKHKHNKSPNKFVQITFSV